MADNFNTSYLATRRQRQQPELDALASKWEQSAAAEAAPPKASSGSGVQAAPAAAPTAAAPTVLQETKRAAVGAVRDAAENTLQLAADFGQWFNNNLIDLRVGSGSWAPAKGGADRSTPVLPEATANATTGGKVARGLGQFIVPFLGATKALKVAGMAGGAARGMVAGAATDAAAFDPQEKRLSNLIMEMTDNDPALGKVIFEFLSADPTDSNATGRAKNALEGMGIGFAVEGLLKGVRFVRSRYFGKGQNPAEATVAAAKEAQAEAAAAAAKPATEQPTSLQAQIELLTGVNNKPRRDVIQKRLDVTKAVRADDAMKAAQGRIVPAQTGVQQGIDSAAGVSRGAPKSAEESAQVLKQIEEAHVAAPAKTHHVFIDQADNTIAFSRTAPSPTSLNLEDLVKPALARAPMERTAEDLIALRAYRQMQEAAFPGIIKPGDTPLREPRSIEVVTSNARKEQPANVPANNPATKEAPVEGAQAAKATADSITINVGDSVVYGGGQFEGIVERIAKGGKVAVRTPEGKIKVVTPDDADPLMASIEANNAAIMKATGRAQAGNISPAVLANMASAGLGGVLGLNSAEDDATLADKLSLAFGGALAGLGMKVGAQRVLSHGERGVIEAPDAGVASLSRAEVRNIAPIDSATMSALKKNPVVPRAKVDEMVTAAKSGGYKALAEQVKKTDFNFDHLDTPEDVAQMVNSFSKVFEKETALAKHGTQSFEQISELADELGAGKASLRELYQDTDNLGARILAHRALLAASATKVTSMAKFAMSGDGDAILSLRKHVALHATIQAQMKGIQTEVGRALAQFRITSSAVDLAVNERNELIEAMGGHAANIRFAQQLSDIVDPKKLNAVTRKSAVARTQDALYEAWINGLLSSPVTHAVNAVSNGLVAIGSVAERGTAAMVGKVLRTGADSVDSAEVKAYTFGMIEGLRDALLLTKHGLDTMKRAAGEARQGNWSEANAVMSEGSNVWKAAATDMPVLDNAAFATKEMSMQTHAFTADRFGWDPRGVMGHVADGLGTLLRLPGRALTTSDELFKTIHYRGELKAQAYRKAREQGLEGDALVNRIAQLIEDPTPELRAQALNSAREGTFTSPLSGGMLHIQAGVAKVPGLRYIMPFIRTPANIMAYVGTRTPVLNLMAESVRTEFKAGGARRDMMIAKTAIGGTMYALGAYLAAQGVLVGGGDKDQEAEKIGGEIPYSAKFGKTSVAFNRMDPYGMFLGLATDISDISGHIDDTEVEGLAQAAVLALSRNLVSKSYLSGLVDLIEMIDSRNSAGVQRYFNKQAGSIVPAWLNAVNKEGDPVMKEAWSMMDTIKSRIPGFSKDLPSHLNIFGEPMKFKGGLGPDIVSPFRTSEASSDPAATEIARLNLDLKHPPRSIGGGDGRPGIDLTPKQYHRYMELIGGMFKPAVTQLINSPQYERMPENADNNVYVEAKAKSIKQVYINAKKGALALLLKEDKGLRSEFETNLRNAGNALTGQPLLPFEEK